MRNPAFSISALATSTLAASVLALSLALPAQAQLFGPSDEEKAHEAGQDAQIQQLTTQAQQLDGRVRTLEDKVQSLTDTLAQTTNSNEELRHQIDLLNQKIDREEKDFAYRLCMVSAQQLGAGAGGQGLNCDAAAAGGGTPAPQPQGYQPGASLPPLGGSEAGQGNGDSSTIDASGGAPRQLGRPPGTLGTLPMGSGAMGSGSTEPPPPAPSPGGNVGQFDQAMNLLGRMQYNEAKAAFRAYADANPDDADLSPQALYWIGHVDYIQRDYDGAQRAFAEEISKYPHAPRSPDSMLELGQTLLAMGKTRDGCTTLTALKSKFPKASASTVQAAAAARRSACR